MMEILHFALRMKEKTMTEPKRMTEELIRYYCPNVNSILKCWVGMDITLTNVASLIEDTGVGGSEARAFFGRVLLKEQMLQSCNLSQHIAEIRDALLSRLAKIEAAKGPEVVEIAEGHYVGVERLARFLMVGLAYENSHLVNAKLIANWIAGHNSTERRGQ
jgi:hypothetical protein